MKRYLLVSGVLFFCSHLMAQNAQISLNDYPDICPRAQFGVPVSMVNVNGMDSLKLTLSYNGDLIEYIEYGDVYDGMESSLKVASSNDKIVISWKGDVAVNIDNDVLVQLEFRAIEGAGDITWLAGDDSYLLNGTLPIAADFTNGSFTMLPRMTVKLIEQSATCRGDDKASYLAQIRNAPRPLAFLWDGFESPFDSLKVSLTDGNHQLKVTDANGCFIDTTYVVEALPAADLEIVAEPKAEADPVPQIYIENPTVTFSFQNNNSEPVDSWKWHFGDKTDTVYQVEKPVHTFLNAAYEVEDKYVVTLIATNLNGCDTTLYLDMPIKNVKVMIPNIFTPNGDGINDLLEIVRDSGSGEEGGSNLKAAADGNNVIEEEYLRIELSVFNRYGRLVYESNDYHHDWNGGDLADGTYYYVAKIHGFFHTDDYKGVITILRSGN